MDYFGGLFPSPLQNGGTIPPVTNSFPSAGALPLPYLGLGGLPGPATNAFPGTEVPTVANTTAGADTPVGARTEGDRLAEALRGVRAPAAPELQRLTLPSNAPAPRQPVPMKGGDLMQFLTLLNAGGGATAKTGLDLPSTLGAALRGR